MNQLPGAPGQAGKVIERTPAPASMSISPASALPRACWPAADTDGAGRRKDRPRGPASFDPPHLIQVAHARGIEVHPWFCVCYADPRWEPLRLTSRRNARQRVRVHNPAFRKFAVDLMMEVVQRYDVDGINLTIFARSHFGLAICKPRIAGNSETCSKT